MIGRPIHRSRRQRVAGQPQSPDGMEQFRVGVTLVDEQTDRGVLGHEPLERFESRGSTSEALWADAWRDAPVGSQMPRKLASAETQIKRMARHGRSAPLAPRVALAWKTAEIPGGAATILPLRFAGSVTAKQGPLKGNWEAIE